MLQPQLIEKPALTVVGLEAPFIGGLSPDSTVPLVIGPLWEQFVPRAGGVPQRLGHDMFGVIYSRAEAERKHPDELQYIAAVPVESPGELPDGMVAHTVPTGTFAVFIHRGPIQNLGATLHEIYRLWLPQSAYQHAQVADVELYDQRFHCENVESEKEYWISVVPKPTARP